MTYARQLARYLRAGISAEISAAVTQPAIDPLWDNFRGAGARDINKPAISARPIISGGDRARIPAVNTRDAEQMVAR